MKKYADFVAEPLKANEGQRLLIFIYCIIGLTVVVKQQEIKVKFNTLKKYNMQDSK